MGFFSDAASIPCMTGLGFGWHFRSFHLNLRTCHILLLVFFPRGFSPDCTTALRDDAIMNSTHSDEARHTSCSPFDMAFHLIYLGLALF